MNISMNPNGELYQSAVNAPGAIDIPESFLNEARQFRELNMRYACAIREAVTRTLDVYVYQALMKNNDYSMSSAASVFQSVVGFILIIAANKLVKRYESNSALF